MKCKWLKYTNLPHSIPLCRLMAICILIAIIGFIVLANGAMSGNMQQIDNWILLALRQEENLAIPIGPPWLWTATRDVTALGSDAVLVVVTLLSIGYCAVIRRFDILSLLAMVSAGSIGLDLLLKAFFCRPRPDIVPHLAEVSSTSFPSGHALESIAIYFTLSIIIAQMLPGYSRKAYVISMAFLLVAWIGLSRIYLGVHYPSDVLAGWLMGLAWALGCWLVMVYFHKKPFSQKNR